LTHEDFSTRVKHPLAAPIDTYFSERINETHMGPLALVEISDDSLLHLLAETYMPFAAVLDFSDAEGFLTRASSMTLRSSESLPAKTVVQHAEKRDTPMIIQPLRS
jgi:hypothetical protein